MGWGVDTLHEQSSPFCRRQCNRDTRCEEPQAEGMRQRPAERKHNQKRKEAGGGEENKKGKPQGLPTCIDDKPQ